MKLPQLDDKNKQPDNALRLIDERENPIAYAIGYLAAVYDSKTTLAQTVLLLQRSCPIECIRIAEVLRDAYRLACSQNEPLLPWEQRLKVHNEAAAAAGKKV